MRPARQRARLLTEEHAAFVEIYVATSLEECARRDPKGLYEKAYAGEIPEFTGVSDPYEEPDRPGNPGRDRRPHARRGDPARPPTGSRSSASWAA